MGSEGIQAFRCGSAGELEFPEASPERLKQISPLYGTVFNDRDPL